MAARRRQRASKKRVRAIPPESPAARDEGPRLIPLPDRDPHQTPGVPHHPADGYVGIANEAIRIWKNEPQSNKKPQDGKQ